ncbi:7-cyano-7-deazaguanine synthase [uncultured Clostridium sp.]|uniref:7-cyano-7-deazaguanine synthase n=1 Tax=uncultured Clostridium sp. TaxID=59620 RepID=UPI00260C727A|nr:7-cyano-7-deazaguanine synthase [uncultured Clostridium sp.]
MKCIVSLSGGRDSATCLGLAVERYGAENVYAIGFEYGSTHPQELECAKKIAAYYGVPYQIITIDPSIFAGSTCTMLQGSEREVQKDKTYEQILSEKEGKVDTYVPFRNGLFSAYVAAKAESLVQQFDEDVVIMLGQHADDSGYYVDENGNEMLDESKAAYPDCTVKFVKAFEKVVEISSVGRVHYEAPFVKMHKWELIKIGMQFNKPVPYTICLSCYDPIIYEDGTFEECGRCATCLDVKANMEKALKAIEEENK